MISVTQHEKNLRLLRCIVSHKIPPTLHHCHGGSMNYIDGLPNPGMAQKNNPFLQIPIHEDFHIGNWGVDSGTGVERWEELFGPQEELLHEVSELLGYDVFQEALEWDKLNRKA